MSAVLVYWPLSFSALPNLSFPADWINNAFGLEVERVLKSSKVVHGAGGRSERGFSLRFGTEEEWIAPISHATGYRWEIEISVKCD